MTTKSGLRVAASEHGNAVESGNQVLFKRDELISNSSTTIPESINIVYFSIPHQPYFFGRKKELEIIAGAICPEARTWGALIDGPGGIGKTALAIKAGHDAPVENFPLKIFLSAKIRQLTPKGEEELKDFMLPNYQDLLKELGKEIGEDRLEMVDPNERSNEVRRALAGKRALIIIDNLETFPNEERDRLFQFLTRLPPSCKAIVTSRRRSDVDARIVRLDRMLQDEALSFIAELAKSENRRLLAKSSEAERIELYEITQGNPLLIRWLAGQLGREGSQCRTIAEACEFLKSAPKGNDPLEYIFGDLLDTFTESETKVLAALTHYTRPARVEWIADMTGLAQRAAQTALEDLADRALVVADNEAKNFLLPQLAAHFIKSKRPEAVAQTGDRLCDKAYVLAIENGYQNYERFNVLEIEWETIMAALPLFIKGDNDRLQVMYSALGYFMDFTGRWNEWIAMSLLCEEKAATVKDYFHAGWRALQSGYGYYLRGETKEVLTSAKRCAEHFEKAKTGAREKVFAIHLRGLGHKLAKDYPEAKEAFVEALKSHSALNPESDDVAVVLNDIAETERLQGNYDEAEKNFNEALRIARKIKYDEGVVTYTGNLAALALDREDWLKAEKLAREALELDEKIGRQDLIGSDCRILAKALARQGKGAEALPYAKRAVEIFTKLRVPDRLEKAEKALKECEGEGQQI